jgi:hypothetical protein
LITGTLDIIYCRSTTVTDCEFEFDLGSGLRWGNDRFFFVTSNRCIPLKIHSAEVLSCVLRAEIMKLFSVVFCVVGAAHKLATALVTIETPNKRRPGFVTNVFPRPLSLVLRDYPRDASELHYLE